MPRQAPSTDALHSDDVTAEGECSAFQQLARWAQKNTRWLARQLRRHDRSRADIDDLIQEAIFKTLRSCERGGVVDPTAVLVRAVSRLSMDDCRNRSRHPNDSLEEIERVSTFIDPAPPPEDVIAAEQCWSLIAEVLDDLEDERMRQAFLLHSVDGLSYRQVGQQLHVSPATVQRDVTWVNALIMDMARRRRIA